MASVAACIALPASCCANATGYAPLRGGGRWKRRRLRNERQHGPGSRQRRRRRASGSNLRPHSTRPRERSHARARHPPLAFVLHRAGAHLLTHMPVHAQPPSVPPALLPPARSTSRRRLRPQLPCSLLRSALRSRSCLEPLQYLLHLHLHSTCRSSTALAPLGSSGEEGVLGSTTSLPSLLAPRSRSRRRVCCPCLARARGVQALFPCSLSIT